MAVAPLGPYSDAMSEPVTRKSLLDADGPSVLELAPVVNPYTAVLAVLAVVLLIGGVITASIGLGTAGQFDGAVLGQSQGYDQAVATAVVGGATIVLGVLVGTVWLVVGAAGWYRRR